MHYKIFFCPYVKFITLYDWFSFMHNSVYIFNCMSWTTSVRERDSASNAFKLVHIFIWPEKLFKDISACFLSLTIKWVPRHLIIDHVYSRFYTSSHGVIQTSIYIYICVYIQMYTRSKIISYELRTDSLIWIPHALYVVSWVWQHKLV